MLGERIEVLSIGERTESLSSGAGGVAEPGEPTAAPSGSCGRSVTRIWATRHQLYESCNKKRLTHEYFACASSLCCYS